MEHLVDHLETISLPTVKGEDAIVPEGVTQRSADVDEIDWWSRFSSVKAGAMPLSASLTTVASSVTAPISSSSAAVSSQSALTEADPAKT